MSADGSPTRVLSVDQAYDAAEEWCHRTISLGHDMLFRLDLFHDETLDAATTFGFPFESINSLFRNAHVAHMKRHSHQMRCNVHKHVKAYLSGTSILELSKRSNYPPSMLARLIVEHVAVEMRGNRKGITDAMRDPIGVLGDAERVILPDYMESERIGGDKQSKDEISQQRPLTESFSQKTIVYDCQRMSRLALEVIEAIESDPLYGPRQDRERHNVGIEYELLLEQTLHSMDIPFETEAQLRVRGTARTPDILLSCPVGLRVRQKETPNDSLSFQNGLQSSLQFSTRETEDGYEWNVVCWIDSKALFGDVETHNNSVLPQVETYVHRFGPGLVIYWFGHAPVHRLGNCHGDVVVVGGQVPDFFLLPTGEVASQGARNLSDIP